MNTHRIPEGARVSEMRLAAPPGEIKAIAVTNGTQGPAVVGLVQLPTNIFRIVVWDGHDWETLAITSSDCMTFARTTDPATVAIRLHDHDQTVVLEFTEHGLTSQTIDMVADMVACQPRVIYAAVTGGAWVDVYRR